METCTWTVTDAGTDAERHETPVDRRIADLERSNDVLRFEVATLHTILDDVIQRVVALSKKPDPKPEPDSELVSSCESCGYRVGRYWHGLRKTLCRRCAEESDYARAHPWRMRAKRAGEVALLVGAVVVPFSALAAILFRIL